MDGNTMKLSGGRRSQHTSELPSIKLRSLLGWLFALAGLSLIPLVIFWPQLVDQLLVWCIVGF